MIRNRHTDGDVRRPGVEALVSIPVGSFVETVTFGQKRVREMREILRGQRQRFAVDQRRLRRDVDPSVRPVADDLQAEPRGSHERMRHEGRRVFVTIFVRRIRKTGLGVEAFFRATSARTVPLN